MRYEHLYVHVPFCARRCVYCDFSIAVRATVPVHDYVAAVEAEFRERHRDSSLELKTLYFGGGTPSKLGADGVRRLMDAIQSHALILNDAEVTLEANPEDISIDTVRAWRVAGINRLSLGVQSFDDAVLKWMHRTHDADGATRAVSAAREGGISNVSIDLIFAAPADLTRSWARDVDTAISLELPHMSVYGLTVEPQTPFGRWIARHDVDEAPEEQFEREFLDAHIALTGAGFEHYEVSNYARPGFQSRHNLAYWDRRPYAAIGPSAHEFDGAVRRWNTDPYADWIRRISEGRSTVEGAEDLDKGQIAAELTYLGLRTSRGIETSHLEIGEVRALETAGFAHFTDRLRLTPEGWLRLDSIAANLTIDRSRY